MVAGKVMGPRPGKAACSFGQGIVEMVLRLSAGVSCIAELQNNDIIFVL